MITIKSEREIELMREAGGLVARVLDMLENEIGPGISTKRLDELAEQFIRDHNAVPSFLNYVPKGESGVTPYPATLCVSIDEEVVHGVPSTKRIIHEGEIVSVDCGVYANIGNFMLCYDISDTAALRAVAAEVAAECAMVQRSVYWLRAPVTRLAALLKRCSIHLETSDRLWAYPLGASRALWRMGEQAAPSLIPIATHHW